MMTITINGENHDLEKPLTVAELVMSLGIVAERVAVMVNGRIVPRAGRDAVTVQEHDKVEIVTFMGGG